MATPTQRRSYIWSVLSGNKPLSYSALVKRFPGINRQSVVDDIAFVEEFTGSPIQKIKVGKEIAYLSVKGAINSETAVTGETNVEAKTLLSQYVADLIYGNDINGSDPSGVRESFLPVIRSELQKMAPRGANDLSPLGEQASIVRDRLESFWLQQNRIIAIDSGTTTQAIGKALSLVRIPDPYARLSSLAICTNCRLLFSLLGRPQVQIRAIVTGGQQLFGTTALAGGLTEMFIRQASVLYYGLGVVGTTAVDLDRMVCHANSQEEAAVKSLFFEKSELRIIVLDDSKLGRRPLREAYHFVAINRNQVDLIITNAPFKTVSEERKKQFYDGITKIKRRGVPVLVATSNETEDYHSEDEE